MKTIRCMLACLLLAAFLLTGCGQTVEKPNADTDNKQPVTSTEKYPDYYVELSELIGKTKAEVLTELKLQESEIEEQLNTGFYSTPITVAFEGVEFRLVLGFATGTDYLCSFNYWAAYESDPENAAKDAETIATYIAEVMGEPDSSGETALQDIAEAKMLEAFSGAKSMQTFHYWKLTDETTQAQKDYMEMMEKEYPNLFPKGAAYSLEMTVNYIKETDTAHIKLDFGISHNRSTNNEN